MDDSALRHKSFFIALIFVLGLPSMTFSNDTAIKLPLKLKWVTKLKKEKVITGRPYQFSSPNISGNNIYVGTASGYLYSLTARNGHKNWHTKLSGGVYSEPVVEGEHVFVADRKGTLYSLSRDSGKIEWQTEVGNEVSSRPLITDSDIYVVTVSKQLIAVDKEGHGKKRQTQKTAILPKMTIKGSSDPILYKSHIYVGYSDGIFVCYRASDGYAVWARQLSGILSQFTDVDATPLIQNDVIYVSTTDGKTFALTASDGRTIWETNAGGPNKLVLDNGRILVSGNGVLSALDVGSGRLIWEQKFNEPEISAPAISGGLAVVASTQDKLYVVDTNDGDIKFQRFLSKGSFGAPLIHGNVVYIMTNSSRIFALQGS